ncbi:Adaptor protein complex beta subunit [Suhomyces tanzawaensis NRRL Y-17324]|uniref:AP complex subunit beta n=1 Tax=Suhomyces tanzawaensis NRRL Y-17324 TaxID=984487 RepID=A0A1E4SDD2_9ASCO|nr:Adaptor protein complex beta subunit [Suhomyces tanzawaensis NRRL Y-17324]ODV77476.1 Adaptor protein complex beta subunit [Suhomyces tanzawaensis NRRL Y-17324]
MSDGKLFTKSKSVELKAELDQAFKKLKSQNRIKIILKKVIANIVLHNNELVNLMPDIISLMKIDDLAIRKMCFQYLIAYCPLAPKLALDAIPFLNRFKDDISPIMRSLALKTMTSIPIKEFMELSFSTVKFKLEDADPYVRKIAAFSVSKLYQYDAERTEKEGFIDSLNELLYDKNQIVVSNALAALSYITEQSKTLSLTIDKAHSLTLISYLSNTNEWCQVYLLNSLMSYVPSTTNEALDLIEATIPSLQHENSSVVLNAIKVIIYYSNYVKNPELILPSLPKRLGASLVSLLSKPAEIQFLVLRNVILLLLGRKELLNVDVEMFFCRYDDPIYVKDTKLEIIYLLANESNSHIVLRELEEYAIEIDVSMSRKAIRAFGNLAVKLPKSSNECVDCICDLISNGIPYIIQESVIVIKNILRRYPRKFNFAIDVLVKHYKYIDEPDSKTAMIWILGQYCEGIPDVYSIFEEFISTFKEDPIEVQSATLTAVTKYYLKMPQQGEALVLKVLKWATEEIDNPDIRDRGFFYWRLLSSEEANGQNGEFQENTKRIILSNNPSISSENDNIDPNILEELELNIGTLASIYLKPVQHVFRLANRKFLPQSPALQPRPKQSPISSESSPAPDEEDDPAPPPLRPYLNGNQSDNFLHVRRNNSQRSSKLSLPRQASFDSGFSNEEFPAKKGSFAQRLSRKASMITSRKNSTKY